jgi:hypothetical protein
MGKYTFLSKWTVLILTIIAVMLAAIGWRLAFAMQPNHLLIGLALVLVGMFTYAIAWIVALLDSLQERKFFWSVGLILLLPFAIGPLLYSFVGPRNTR